MKLNGYDSYRVKISTNGKKSISISRGNTVVSSVSRWATNFAIDVLKSGGNAFDAAFALGFGLTLYHPQAGNIGGGGYLMYFRNGWERPKLINYREKSPLAIAIDKYFDENGNVDPEKSSFGPLSVCTPGSVKAFYLLHSRYGKISASEILNKLSNLSIKGYPLNSYQVECLNRLSPKLSISPESRNVYVKKSGKYKIGDIFKNYNLAKTFTILAEKGEKEFYQGGIANSIDREIRSNGGFLSLEDLKRYNLKETDPIFCEIEGYKVWTVPPEGGGAVLLNILNILNNENFKKYKIDSIEYYHRLTQASKVSFINRHGYIGDIPINDNLYYKRVFDRDFNKKAYQSFIDKDIPTDKFLSMLNFEYNSMEFPYNNNTTHFSIIDSEGNAVSNSYTLNLRYGSKWSVNGYGFLLNGSMDAFSFKPGKVNYFGIVGNRANIIAPGKRPASSMAPVIITDKNGIVALIGTPGGPTIPSTLANIILPLISGEKNYEYMVQRGRIHHQAWPDILYLEKGWFSDDFINKFKDLGYTVKYKNEPIGDVHAIFRDGNKYIGISDYRREGFSLSL